jgi:arylsulfatase A
MLRSLILSTLFAAAFSTAAETPNIIIILADDLGYGDVSACNPDSKIATPNIDRIAREGMLFTDAHTSSAVCTPTRYSLLTGRYHWRTHLQKGVLGGFSRPLISAGSTTLASLLGQAGYHTACIGKWHLGMDWQLQDGAVANDSGNFSQPFTNASKVDYTKPIQNGPVDRGFDTFYGISASLDMFPYVWIKDRLPTEIASVEKAFHRPGPAGPNFEAVDVQPGITRALVDLIASHRAGSGKPPFFAYVPLAAPHTPILPTAEFQGKSGINAYADFVLQVDADVGLVLSALDEHGIADDTLIVFTSDNGCSPAANIPELQAAGHEPSHIFRGHKADIFDGGHRVPFLVRWPGRVPAGSRCDHLTGQIDFAATFAELTDRRLSHAEAPDSVSFLPLLLDPAAPPHRSELIMQSIDGSFTIRDGKWKLNLCPGSGGWSPPRPGRDDATGLPEFQLYDMERDPAESENLATAQPERVAKMRAALESAIARGRTTPGPVLGNDAPIQLIKGHPSPAAKAKAGKGKQTRQP